LSCTGTSPCSTLVEASGPGYLDISGYSNTHSDGTYAYMMAGNLFGTDWGIYGGASSYFNLGKTDITSATTELYTAHPTSQQRVNRFDSTMGAPNGPYQACMAELSGGTCSGTRTFAPGAYKFNVFGYTYESSAGQFASGVATAQASGHLPSSTTHLAVRQQVSAVGFRVTEVRLNGGAHTLSTLGNTDVTDLALATPAGTINYSFPLRYNYGTLGGQDGASDYIKIKVSAVDETALYIDYLLPFASVSSSDRWWLYDPDITTSLEGALPFNGTDVIESITEEILNLELAAAVPPPAAPGVPPPAAPGGGDADGGGDGGGGGGGVAIIAGAAGGGVVVLAGLFYYFRVSKKKWPADGSDKAVV